MRTFNQFPTVSREAVNYTFHPNKLGYSLMVDALCDEVIPHTRWGLSILSNPVFPLAHPNDGANAKLDPVAVACTVTMPLIIKKYNVVFR